MCLSGKRTRKKASVSSSWSRSKTLSSAAKSYFRPAFFFSFSASSRPRYVVLKLSCVARSMPCTLRMRSDQVALCSPQLT